MINYVTLGVSDIEKSASFYESLLENFGVKRLVNMERIKYIGKSMKEPMIAVCIPWDEKEPSPGNGNMFSIAPGWIKCMKKHCLLGQHAMARQDNEYPESFMRLT